MPGILAVSLLFGVEAIRVHIGTGSPEDPRAPTRASSSSESVTNQVSHKATNSNRF